MTIYSLYKVYDFIVLWCPLHWTWDYIEVENPNPHSVSCQNKREIDVIVSLYGEFKMNDSRSSLFPYDIFNITEI